MELDLEKLAKRRLYKLTGVVVSFNWINNSTGNLMVSKGSGPKKQLFKFTVMLPEAKVISELKKNYRIRIWFKIKTNEYGGKFYTELVIKYHEYWQVNELKKKREAALQERMEESQYVKSINIPFTNNDFLSKAIDFTAIDPKDLDVLGFDQDIVSEH